MGVGTAWTKWGSKWHVAPEGTEREGWWEGRGVKTGIANLF